MCAASQCAPSARSRVRSRLNFGIRPATQKGGDEVGRSDEAEDQQGLTMRYSIHTMGPRMLGALLVATAVSGTAPATKAGSAYDGNWSVVIRASGGGECKTTSLPLRISNGSVGYNGYLPASVSGSVRDNGSVRVSVSGGGRSANGSGLLSGNSGSGTWTSPSSECSGTWVASRKG
jgi:hypothetical protein